MDEKRRTVKFNFEGDGETVKCSLCRCRLDNVRDDLEAHATWHGMTLISGSIDIDAYVRQAEGRSDD